MPFVTLLVSLLTAGQTLPAPPPAAVPPPPPAPGSPKRFVTFDPGAIVCDGETVTPERREMPGSAVGFAYPREQSLAGNSYNVRFGIDADGRAIDIIPDHDTVPGWVNTSDIMPALAAWRFASGAPHSGCRIAFAIHAYPIDQAPPVAAMRYVSLPHGDRSADYALFNRDAMPGADCNNEPRAGELVRVWPDFEKIPQPPGTRSFAMIGYDIAKSGRPTDVHIVASDGNRDLDRRGVAAIRRSRFTGGARTGCRFEFHRTPIAPLKSPPSPDVAAFRPADADCEGVGAWTKLALTTFPEAFRKRSIEGWAIVRYDVAPWGETGDFKVLKAEPAEPFGQQAIETIRRSTKPPSKRGYTGCVDKVAFKMTKPGSDETID
jgi:TonB family protein